MSFYFLWKFGRAFNWVNIVLETTGKCCLFFCRKNLVRKWMWPKILASAHNFLSLTHKSFSIFCSYLSVTLLAGIFPAGSYSSSPVSCIARKRNRLRTNESWHGLNNSGHVWTCAGGGSKCNMRVFRKEILIFQGSRPRCYDHKSTTLF